MKYCSKCGNQLLDEAVMCPKCGCPTEVKKSISPEQKEYSKNHTIGAICLISAIMIIIITIIAAIMQ